jgi:hypothetical protein
MKTKIMFALCVLLMGSFLVSCDEDVAKPVITLHELGDGETHGDDHTAKVGGDLHIDIDIVADGKIDKIMVHIHPENGNGGWELDTTYTKFSGLKNTTFHEHVEISKDATSGDYHFDFIVTDMEGNSSSIEAELELK